MTNSLLDLLQQSQIDEKATLLATGDIHQVHFGKKEILHQEGEVCTYFELILSGHVVVERIDEAGNLLTISSISKGDIL
jgi:CRP-like cAMP-binding protein